MPKRITTELEAAGLSHSNIESLSREIHGDAYAPAKDIAKEFLRLVRAGHFE